MRDYYGWRARIGLVYMASSTVMEPEFYAMCPEGVSVHTARLPFKGATISGISDMMESERVEQATAELATAPLHVILFGGTSATFLKGVAWDEHIKQRMAAVANGVPVTTTTSALLAALNGLGLKKLTFVAPYVPEITEIGCNFLKDNGFEILGSSSLGVSDDHELGEISLDTVYRLARDTFRRGSDGVFISCTNLRSIGAIEALEEDLGVPVVSAIQASFWHGLRMAGVGSRVPGFGRLFDI
jgi:maleate isomerase